MGLIALYMLGLPIALFIALAALTFWFHRDILWPDARSDRHPEG